jgi:hypothetical protein
VLQSISCDITLDSGVFNWYTASLYVLFFYLPYPRFYLLQVHLEAARLLAFTEDEFMKTLDWKV